MTHEIIERLTRIETKLDRAIADVAEAESRLGLLEQFRQTALAYIVAIAAFCALLVSSAGAAIAKIFHP